MGGGRAIRTVFLPTVCGCASNPPLTTLDAVKAKQSRTLTMSCFQHSPGWRAVYNDQATFFACRQWAESQVR